MTDAERSRVNLKIHDRAIAGPVLERLVSAAAVRADLSVDRIVDAMTVVDAFVAASQRSLPNGATTAWSVSFGPGTIHLALDGLETSQAEAVRSAAVLPEIGDVLAQTSHSVEIIENEGDSSLVVTIA